MPVANKRQKALFRFEQGNTKVFSKSLTEKTFVFPCRAEFFEEV